MYTVYYLSIINVYSILPLYNKCIRAYIVEENNVILILNKNYKMIMKVNE